ncbi:hypothetical protein T265_07697 [Opisthorchis viverrini]|uniref:Armadillo repeat-containing protein 1 n=1 Tax=Opisthorchis viverrini TaxID=6198 RepID=A0A074ZMZ6_OPIVI|nr:hypothetical protein T265_07697 [Opisthorchis viverrini]KER24695.1 hypothetical protein T265_07697 [Opisthorchis viverrini]
MDELSTLQAFKSLAEDGVGYSTLLQDRSCLQGLVVLLSNPNPEVVITILQTLCQLCRRPGGPSVLKTLLGLSDQLQGLLKKDFAQTTENQMQLIIQLARDVYNSAFGVRTTTNVNSPNSRPKNVVLRLYGVHSEDDAEVVRSQLLKVRGVVSITFQLQKHRVIVCTVPQLDPECLVRAVRAAQRHQPSSTDSPLDHPHPAVDEIKARIVRKRTVIHRSDSVTRTKTPSTKCSDPKLTAPVPLPPYLEETADLFEVDESRAAPKIKNRMSISGNDPRSSGPLDWLSDFLERSFFW